MHAMEVVAPSDWTCIDFISDLHLQETEPGTLSALTAYLATTPASALFILGDLFEVWVGDDCLDHNALPFARQCAALLHATGKRIPLFIMVGNRDFLMGEQLMRTCQASALPDPSVLSFAGERWLLTHGDALCLADLPYQRFREQVRSPEWQRQFLAKPFPERLAIAADLRARSEMSKQQATTLIDLDSVACQEWLSQHRANHMVHGHTHQPAIHALNDHQNRVVLSDWDAGARPPRAEALRLRIGQAGKPVLQRIAVLPATSAETD